MRLGRVLVIAFGLLVGGALTVRALERPPRLAAATGCQVYRGTSTGNDPSVLIELELCTDDGGNVHGRCQRSSLLSGYSVRALTGSWNADRSVVSLRDTAFVVEQPADGWRFCLVDQYSLRPDGARLRGAYDSAACRDHGEFDLALDPASTQPDRANTPAKTSPPPLPPAAPPRVPQRTSGCSWF